MAPADDTSTPQPTMAGESQLLPPRESWSEAEKWAWTCIRKGELADFNERFGWLDPRRNQDWTGERASNRALSAAFLQTILLDDPYRGALTRKGVRIDGAWFQDVVDLESSRLSIEVRLNGCRFLEPFLFSYAVADNLISIMNSKFINNLNMRGSRFRNNLIIKGAEFNELVSMNMVQICGGLLIGETCFRDFDLGSAKINGQLEITSSICAGVANLSSVEVGSSVIVRKSLFYKNVNMRGAKIGGQIDMSGSKLAGTVIMDSAEVAGHLLMREEAEFQEVDLRSAKIGGNIDMSGSKFAGTVSMDSTEVGLSVFARGTVFDKNAKWSCIFLEIGSSLDPSGATLTILDLTGTRIGRELRLGTAIGHDAPLWQKGSRMMLRNADVGTVQDREDSWPEMLELEGLTYRRLGGFGAEGTADIGKRNSAWFIEWLGRDPTYSPQPYEQLARMLREGGQAKKAGEVLYAGRKREAGFTFQVQHLS